MNYPEIALPTYARKIGITLDSWDGVTPVLGVDYSDIICGNPGMLHGGVVGGLLEMAAVVTLEADLHTRQDVLGLTRVSTTTEFLRPAGERRTYASAKIIRAGRRFANLQSWIWQESRDKPVATALVNILILPEAPAP